MIHRVACATVYAFDVLLFPWLDPLFRCFCALMLVGCCTGVDCFDVCLMYLCDVPLVCALVSCTSPRESTGLAMLLVSVCCLLLCCCCSSADVLLSSVIFVWNCARTLPDEMQINNSQTLQDNNCEQIHKSKTKSL